MTGDPVTGGPAADGRSTAGRARTRGASPAWGHGKALLLDAARELFAEKGYTATSTKEIAERASVTEPMLFRHFGTKAGLFEQAVLAPFNDYISEYMDAWQNRPHGVVGPVQEARAFYGGFYEVLSANRRLIRALIAAETAQGPLAATRAGAPALGTILERFEQVIRRERDERGFRSFDPAVQTRLMFGLVFSIALHEDWMFDGSTGLRPDAGTLIDEMAKMTIHGAYDRTGHPSWDEDQGPT